MPVGLFLLGPVKIIIGLVLLAASVSLAGADSHGRLEKTLSSPSLAPVDKAGMVAAARQEHVLNLLAALAIGTAALTELVGGFACFVKRPEAWRILIVSQWLVIIIEILFIAFMGGWVVLGSTHREGFGLEILLVPLIIVPSFFVTWFSIGIPSYLRKPAIKRWFGTQ
jgi:hypothetical protein